MNGRIRVNAGYGFEKDIRLKNNFERYIKSPRIKWTGIGRNNVNKIISLGKNPELFMPIMEESKFVKADARNKDGSLYEIKKYSRKDLKKFRAHFNKITFVENMDFQNVIEKYDSEKTYFYVDPPYWKTENYYSNHDFDRNDHERLANTLKTIKGKFSLSYYDFPILKQWFPKHEYVWVMKEFAKAAAAKSGVKQNMGEELLIMNYGENDNILPSYGEQLDLFKHSFL